MKNEYEIRGDVTAIILNSPKYGLMETLISTSDLERAKEFKGNWYPSYDKVGKTFYVKGNLPKIKGKQKTVKLHRWILGVADPRKQVDHVLHDTLDNCRWALNIVTSAENNQNARRYDNNTSGHTGVGWNKRDEKWVAHIGVNGARKHLGTYEDINEAISARKAAEHKYFEYKTSLLH